jgi:RHS repeat-associated protein
MEKDPEIKGEGNSYTTEFRQYDPRLGRWLSLDPLMSMFPWQSPYCAFDNNPIFYTDPLGLAAEGDKVKKRDTKEYKNADKSANKFAKKVDGTVKDYGKGTKIVQYTDKNGDLKGQIFKQNQGDKYEKSINRLDKLNAQIDDDNIINFTILGAGGGASAVTYGGSVEIKNIWVHKDNDNIHVHNSGRFYLTYGLSYGKNAAGSMVEIEAGVEGGYGFMTNVHPYDNIGQLFENATDVEISYAKGDLSAGVVLSKSKGKNGVVNMYYFFGDWSKSVGTKEEMPLKIPVSVNGGVYGKELKRTILKPTNAADTGKVIINNPSNNLPPMSTGAIKRMDKILRRK